MLETLTLWISAAVPFRDGDHRRGTTVREVRWELGGRELGLIVAYPLAWWPWTVVATISAFEGPDRSAVFAGRRAGWLPGDWDVHEADGQLVGLIRGSHILHAAGEILGRLHRDGHGEAGRIIGPNGSRLVEWKPRDSGVQIDFCAGLEGLPFAKMAVIIAVLIGM